MKNFVTSSFVLTTLLATISQITTVEKTNNIENSQFKVQHKLLDFDYIEKSFKTNSKKENQLLKGNLLSVISLKNGILVFDSTKIE